MTMQCPATDLRRFDNALAKENRERLEKIVPGYNNLQQLSWLREGLRLAQTVGRIVTPDGLGTGWLISEELILTNNHVIPTHPTPGQCWIEFNYEVDWRGTPLPIDRFEITGLVKTSLPLDYSIVAVKGRPGEKYGFNNILDAKRPTLDSSATHYPVIVQHPRGEFKQVALTDNVLVTLDETLVWYTTDTEPGSSGSPVFDQFWRPFALHHAGGPKRLADGKVVILNEGIILERVVSDARDILGKTEHLRSVVSDLLISGWFRSETQEPDLNWYMSNPRLHNAIKLEARGNDEIGPLLAAAAGVAAGAAAAHWAHVTSKEKTPENLTLTLGGTGYVEVSNPQNYTITGMFEHLYERLQTDPLRQQLRQIGRDRPYYEVAPLAAAFIAGVAAGAAAYRAGIK